MKPWLILAAIIALGLALRLYNLNDHGMFVDEVYSVLVATGTGDPELMQFDSSRPLYFLLLKFWYSISSDDGWLRLFSVIFGTANIGLIYYFGRLAGGVKTGLAAALIMALSPMEIHYSQQVRMYTLGTFLVLAGTMSIYGAVNTGKKILLLPWAIARLLMVLTLPLTALLMGVDLLFVLVENRKKNGGQILKLFAAGFVTVVGFWAPFLAIILKAQSSPYDNWRSTLDVPNPLDYFTLLVNFTASAKPLQESGGPPMHDVLAGLWVIIFPIVLACGLYFCRSEKRMLWPALWGLIPLTFLFVYSLFRPPLFITRYSMFTAPFVYMVIAFGWCEIYRLKRPLAIITAAIYAPAMGSCIHLFFSNPVHEDWRAIAAYLTEHEKPGDEIIVWNYHSKYLLGYYYKGKNRISDLQVRRDAAEGQSREEAEEAPLIVNLDLDEKPKKGQRIWIVTREAAPGWQRMRRVYEEFGQSTAKYYKVLQHTHLNMSDIWEVEEP